MPEPKCAKGECDQRIRCTFYCWWNPTMAALAHERNQYGSAPAKAAPSENRGSDAA